MEFGAKLFHMINARGANLHTTDDVITTLRCRLSDHDRSLSAERETSSSLSQRVATTDEALFMEQKNRVEAGEALAALSTEIQALLGRAVEEFKESDAFKTIVQEQACEMAASFYSNGIDNTLVLILEEVEDTPLMDDWFTIESAYVELFEKKVEEARQATASRGVTMNPLVTQATLSNSTVRYLHLMEAFEDAM